MADRKPTNDKPHGGAYEAFPDAPAAYREATSNATLKALFASAIRHCEDRIDWYDGKAFERSSVAKFLRRWSLVLFAAGTLAPILLTPLTKLAALHDTSEPGKLSWLGVLADLPLAEIGYVLLALAGAFVIFDQFFDVSGSWIRFRQSQARLEVMLAELRFAWAELLAKYGGLVVEQMRVAEFVGILKTFVTKIETLAEAETNQWAEQFRARIDSFDRNPNLKTTLSKPDQGEPGSNAGAGSPGNDSGKDAAAGSADRAAAPAPTTRIVKVLVAVDEADTLEALVFSVNDVPVSLPPDGHVELPLEVAVSHRLVATGRRGGHAVRGELTITPTLDDDARPLAIELV